MKDKKVSWRIQNEIKHEISVGSALPSGEFPSHNFSELSVWISSVTYHFTVNSFREPSYLERSPPPKPEPARPKNFTMKTRSVARKETQEEILVGEEKATPDDETQDNNPKMTKPNGMSKFMVFITKA